MAVTARAQVVFPYFTNLPEDVMTNTFHFENLVTATLEQVADDVTPLLQTFYTNGIYSGIAGMASYLPEALPHINWYDLADPPPRPAYTVPMPLAVTNTNTRVPPEVALVLSFQGALVAGQPQARRRGRVYLGGLTAGHIQEGDASSMPMFESSTINAVRSAANALRTSVAGAGHRWIVRSQTTGNNVLITNGWVDNAPDTQRRRGTQSTLRTLFP